MSHSNGALAVAHDDLELRVERVEGLVETIAVKAAETADTVERIYDSVVTLTDGMIDLQKEVETIKADLAGVTTQLAILPGLKAILGEILNRLGADGT